MIDGAHESPAVAKVDGERVEQGSDAKTHDLLSRVLQELQILNRYMEHQTGVPKEALDDNSV